MPLTPSRASCLMEESAGCRSGMWISFVYFVLQLVRLLLTGVWRMLIVFIVFFLDFIWIQHINRFLSNNKNILEGNILFEIVSREFRTKESNSLVKLSNPLVFQRKLFVVSLFDEVYLFRRSLNLFLLTEDCIVILFFSAIAVTPPPQMMDC